MPSTIKIRVEQKRKLFQLKPVMKMGDSKDNNWLHNLIVSIEAEMEEEDVAWVEKKLNELKDVK